MLIETDYKPLCCLRSAGSLPAAPDGRAPCLRCAQDEAVACRHDVRSPLCHAGSRAGAAGWSSDGRRTIAAGTDHLLVQRVVRAPSHYGIDGETREQAFDDLVAWIRRGVRPEGEDVLAVICYGSG